MVGPRTHSNNMSVFSFSAPYVTEEEEKQERQDLTEQEKLELERDLYGYPDDVTELQESSEQIEMRALEMIVQAIEELPISTKEEYLKAVELVPDLVETESNPLPFLRCENWNAWSAAQRLCEYWNMRVLIFGMERAYLPMTLEGAMRADRAAMEIGLLQILPDDNNGRPILYWDRIRAIPPMIRRDETARIYFYLLHTMSQRESVQRNGYVWIIYSKNYDLYKHVDRVLAKRLLKMVYTVPSNFKALHIFCGSSYSLVAMALSMYKMFGGRYFRLRLHPHAGTVEDLLQRLALYGIDSEHLRNVLDLRGTPNEADNFLVWMDRQRQAEETMQLGSGGKLN